MHAFARIFKIFISPRETFESIEQKPNTLVPYIVLLVAFILMQYFTLDIQMSDRIALIEAKGASAERLEVARNQIQGPVKNMGIILSPFMIPLIWAIFAGTLLFTCNLIFGKKVKFKKLYAIVAWSSLVGIIMSILMTLLVLSKGTFHGVAVDLSLLLSTPQIGEGTSTFYRFLAKFDIFTIWQLILWMIGLGVIYRVAIKKAARCQCYCYGRFGLSLVLP